VDGCRPRESTLLCPAQIPTAPKTLPALDFVGLFVHFCSSHTVSPMLKSQAPTIHRGKQRDKVNEMLSVEQPTLHLSQCIRVAGASSDTICSLRTHLFFIPCRVNYIWLHFRGRQGRESSPVTLNTLGAIAQAMLPSQRREMSCLNRDVLAHPAYHQTSCSRKSLFWSWVTFPRPSWRLQLLPCSLKEVSPLCGHLNRLLNEELRQKLNYMQKINHPVFQTSTNAIQEDMLWTCSSSEVKLSSV